MPCRRRRHLILRRSDTQFCRFKSALVLPGIVSLRWLATAREANSRDLQRFSTRTTVCYYYCAHTFTLILFTGLRPTSYVRKFRLRCAGLFIAGSSTLGLDYSGTPRKFAEIARFQIKWAKPLPAHSRFYPGELYRISQPLSPILYHDSTFHAKRLRSRNLPMSGLSQTAHDVVIGITGRNTVPRRRRVPPAHLGRFSVRLAIASLKRAPPKRSVLVEGAPGVHRQTVCLL